MASCGNMQECLFLLTSIFPHKGRIELYFMLCRLFVYIFYKSFHFKTFFWSKQFRNSYSCLLCPFFVGRRRRRRLTYIRRRTISIFRRRRISIFRRRRFSIFRRRRFSIFRRRSISIFHRRRSSMFRRRRFSFFRRRRISLWRRRRRFWKKK